MIEINNESKSKFFAQYWGQKVFKYNRNDSLIDPNEIGNVIYIPKSKAMNYSFLELKPLSSISDEDAIEVVKICEGFAPENIEFRDRTGDYFASPIKWKQAFSILNPGTKNERIDIIANFSNTKDGVSICSGNEYWRCHTQASDYLRSKGYAFPWMGLSVNEMVEAGWIKLIA